MSTNSPNGKIINGIQQVIDLISLLAEQERSDGWVPTNNEMFRTTRKLQHAIVLQATRNGMEIDEIAKGLDISAEKVQAMLSEPLNLAVDVGVIVRSKHPQGNPLHCGSGVYDSAVVISMTPFVMASHSADMRWGAWKADDVEAIEKATAEQLAICMQRLKS